jgi:hypothetical protein
MGKKNYSLGGIGARSFALRRKLINKASFNKAIRPLIGDMIGDKLASEVIKSILNTNTGTIYNTDYQQNITLSATSFPTLTSDVLTNVPAQYEAERRKQIVETILENISKVATATVNTIKINKNLLPQSSTINAITQTNFIVVNASSSFTTNIPKKQTIDLNIVGVDLTINGYYVYMNKVEDTITFKKGTQDYMKITKNTSDYTVIMYNSTGQQLTSENKISGTYQTADNFQYILGTVLLHTFIPPTTTTTTTMATTPAPTTVAPTTTTTTVATTPAPTTVATTPAPTTPDPNVFVFNNNNNNPGNTVTILPGKIWNISTSISIVCNLINLGTINIQSGGQFSAQNGGQINNDTGGIITQTGGSFYADNGGIINNYGSITLQTGVNFLTSGGTINNDTSGIIYYPLGFNLPTITNTGTIISLILDGTRITGVNNINNIINPFKSLIIPSGVTSIGNSAFSGCTFTGNLTIPNTITRIAINAFQNCGFGGNLTFETGAVAGTTLTIETSAFSGCTFTGGLTISNTVTSIGTQAFRNCGFTGGTLTFETGGTTLTIGSGAFFGCTFTGNLTIPNTVTSIGPQAFQNCGFTGGNLTFEPGAVAGTTLTIVSAAFSGCNFTGGLGLTIPKTVTSITGQFIGTKFTGGLTIPNTVTSIAITAFDRCGFGGTLTFETGAVAGTTLTIGSGAFVDCTFTGNLTIPNTVTSIGTQAFQNCGFGGNLTFETGAVAGTTLTIETSAFSGCTFTGNLTIPNTVTSIGPQAFQNCGFTGGTLTFETGGTTLTIGSGAFFGCNFTGGLGLTIPNTVTSIGPQAFQNCGFTGDLTIPNTVTSIGADAFDRCGFGTTNNYGGDIINATIYCDKTVYESAGLNAFSGCYIRRGVLFNTDKFTYSDISNNINAYKVYPIGIGENIQIPASSIKYISIDDKIAIWYQNNDVNVDIAKISDFIVSDVSGVDNNILTLVSPGSPNPINLLTDINSKPTFLNNNFQSNCYTADDNNRLICRIIMGETTINKYLSLMISAAKRWNNLVAFKYIDDTPNFPGININNFTCDFSNNSVYAGVITTYNNGRPSSFEISINMKYRDLSDNIIYNTVTHELGHVLGVGGDWQSIDNAKKYLSGTKYPKAQNAYNQLTTILNTTNGVQNISRTDKIPLSNNGFHWATTYKNDSVEERPPADNNGRFDECVDQEIMIPFIKNTTYITQLSVNMLLDKQVIVGGVDQGGVYNKTGNLPETSYQTLPGNLNRDFSASDIDITMFKCSHYF